MTTPDPAIFDNAANAVASSLALALADAPYELAPRSEDTPIDIVPGATRAFTVAMSGGFSGALSLFVTETFADAVAAAGNDLLTIVGAALEAGAGELAAVADSDVATSPAAEVAVFDALTNGEGEIAAYPFVRDAAPHACIAIRVADDSPSGGSGAGGGAGVPAPATVGAAAGTDVAPHEFQSLSPAMAGMAGNTRSLAILQDVEMGVTAELGRRRMTVRELLSLTPGTVIELDRAAGSPVDVLVNGTLIARGEVVVIDEEFGIRISEIVRAEDPGA
jgi:flagellar motor switch protein FliN/FliY